jgi:hypothetical protein
LGKTVLVKILVKKTVQQLDRDKRRPAGEIQDELNDQVNPALLQIKRYRAGVKKRINQGKIEREAIRLKAN